MGITGYKYLNGNHQFEYQSREKIKFAGNSRFNVELQIVDESGFVRGQKSTFFTYGYKMKWWCSLGILGGVPGRTISKLSLKTAITGFNLTNLYTDLLPVEKQDKASFLKNFFKSPEFIAERGLAAIEVLEEPDGNINFKIYIQDQALDIGKELAESFGKKVIKESRFGQTSGNASIAGWNFLMSAEDSIILLTDYFMQVDDWNKRNAEIIIEVCAKS